MNSRFAPRLVPKVMAVSVMMTLNLSLFAQTPAPANGAVPAAAPAAGAPAAAPKPYKDVIKDAKEMPGYFKAFRKDDKVWLSIRPEQLDQPFFFTYNIPQSVGERGLYASQMGGSTLAVFRNTGSQIQLVALNSKYYADPGTPQAQFVSEGFSESLLASAPVASMPHGDDKSILIDASALLFADIPGYLTRLETAFRQPYALDTRNTVFAKIHNSDNLTGLRVKAHFSVPKISAPPLTPSPTPLPPPPLTTPDPRSLFVSFYYNFAKLPEQPMAPRVADERVGHFVSSRTDFTSDTSPKTRQHFVNRWRLEKKDPQAALSEPKQPIVYWVDKNVPQIYRKAVIEGILEWNKAFEKIGFKNAIVAKQQAETDDFDTLDANHASVRWFVGADVGFAIGPRHRDPRTGEILDADIGMSDVFARGARRLIAEDVPSAAAPLAPLNLQDQTLFLTCQYGHEKSHELHFATDLLEARGMDMAGPEAEAVAQAYVKDVIMHEVGHTLGLRHNFRSSTIYSLKQIGDPAFTKVNALTGSVMDYTPFNLALKNEKQGEYVTSTLGPYDYLAIEYAYKPIDAANEKAELAKLAARATTEPLLAYATDEDAGVDNFLIGIDPEVNRFDLGDDPLAYYKKTMTLSRELFDRLEGLQLNTGESYERLTRSFISAFRSLSRIAPLAARYVGGVKHLRDRAGTGHVLYEPTPAAKQRDALKLINDGLFRVDSFKFKPELVSRLAIDHFERLEARGVSNPDISLSNMVLGLQRSVLDVLMANSVAQRLLDSGDKVSVKTRLFSLAELYDTLQASIWAEISTGGDISAWRRNLQREHLRRVGDALVKPPTGLPADARSLLRANALELQGSIRAALGKSGGKPMSKEARAHLAESLNTLNEALKASLQRSNV